MNARLLFVLLLVGVLLAFKPRYRRAGLGLCAVVVALLLWVSIREAQTPEQNSPQPTGSPTAADVGKPRAQLGPMQLEGRGAPWRLHGSVQNISDAPIRSVSLNIARYDCPTTAASQSDCVSMWQGVHVLQVSIKPRGTSNIDESFYSHVAVPLQSGVIRDQISITDVE